MPSWIDLHTHSIVSDGTLAPSDLVKLAKKEGLKAIALTDHDHVGGILEARETGRTLGVDVVTGIELSVADDGAGELHLLGYLFDELDPRLLRRLAALRMARLQRGAKMVERLRNHGIDITLADVAREAQLAEGASLGRPHVARALVARGRATSIQDAFDRWLAEGRPAYVPKERLTPQDALLLLHSAGGVASLAHPVTIPEEKRDAAIRRFAKLGLDGLEVIHSKHGPEERAQFGALAAELGLTPTGGSDFHGENKPGVLLGSGVSGNARVEMSTLDALRARLRR